MANLVFACGSRSGESVSIDMGCSHLECFNRPHVLGALDGGTQSGVAVLKDVQSLGLEGVHLLCSKRTNRSRNRFSYTCTRPSSSRILLFCSPLRCECGGDGRGGQRFLQHLWWKGREEGLSPAGQTTDFNSTPMCLGIATDDRQPGEIPAGRPGRDRSGPSRSVKLDQILV